MFKFLNRIAMRIDANFQAKRDEAEEIRERVEARFNFKAEQKIKEINTREHALKELYGEVMSLNASKDWSLAEERRWEGIVKRMKQIFLQEEINV